MLGNSTKTFAEPSAIASAEERLGQLIGEAGDKHASILIFAGGPMPEPPDLVRSLVEAASVVLAVDAGINKLIDAAIRADLLIGDLDSVHQGLDLAQHARHILRYPVEKDALDLELCFDLLSRVLCRPALRDRAIRVILLGALGGRIDMQLANLGAAWRFEERVAGDREFELELRLAQQSLRLFRGPKDIILRGKKGDSLSMLAYGGAVSFKSSTGLKWSLDDLQIDSFSGFGISNRITESPVRVRLVEGRLICVHNRCD